MVQSFDKKVVLPIDRITTYRKTLTLPNRAQRKGLPKMTQNYPGANRAEYPAVGRPSK